MNFRSADLGPWIHGISTFLASEIGLALLTYVQTQLTAKPEVFTWQGFFTGLALTIIAATISASRNNGSVTINTGTGSAIKGIQGARGSVNLVTLAQSAVTEGPAANLEAGDTVITVEGKSL